MSKRKRDFKDEDFDNGLIEDLDGILKVFDTNVTPLLAFVEDNNGRKLLQAWSYYSQSSNHNKLAKVTTQLAAVIECCNKNTSLIQGGSLLIREILESQLKIIYRCLFIGRPAITNPALRLMTAIANFHKGTLVGDLFSTFDFSLKAYNKILTTNDLRLDFLKFYLAFIKNGSFIVRKDLIAQRKIISGWFKGLNEDPEDLVLDTLNVLENQVLKEPAFTKSSKLSFFNDWMIGCLIKLFSRADSVPQKVADLLRLLCTDGTVGIKFQDQAWYSSPSIHNKLLLNVLKSIKPWDDVLQQDLAVDVIRASPELISAYTISVGDTISFDPKLSSFWVSYCTFYSCILRLPLPDLAQVVSEESLLRQPPQPWVVVENVLPKTLSKSALSKALTNESPMIRYLAGEVLVQGLRRLELVKELYKVNRWDISPVTSEVLNRLPDVQILSNCLNTLKEEMGSLLRTVMMMLVASFCRLYPEIVVSSRLTLPDEFLEDLQNAEGLNGLKLVQARSTLTVQAKISKVGKWYNKSGSKYSTFTNLLRLGAINSSLLSQVEELLIDLTRPTMLFQLETFAHPVSALIHCLRLEITTMDTDQQEKLWALIDESVARCMRSPYKYVDEFAQLQNVSGSLSPFIITLIEQWKFVKQPNNQLVNWLNRYLNWSEVIGECQGDIGPVRQLASKAGVENKLVKDTKSKSKFEVIVHGETADLHQITVEMVLELAAAKQRILKEPSLSGLMFRQLSPELSYHVTQPAFFDGLLRLPISREYFKYLRLLSDSNRDLDLGAVKKAVEGLPVGIQCDAFWLDLPGWREAGSISSNGHVFAQYIECKTYNGLVVDLKDVGQLEQVESNHDEVTQAIERNVARYATLLNDHDLTAVMNLLLERKNDELLATLIKSSGQFTLESKKVTSISVASAISQYTEFDDKELFAILASSALNDMDNEDSLVVLREALAAGLEDENLDKICQFLDSVDGNITVSPVLVRMAADLARYRPNGVKLWAKKVVAWLIKNLESGDSLSSTALAFVQELGDYFFKYTDAWSVLPASMINNLVKSAVTQLTDETSSLLARLVFTSYGKPLDREQLLQLILEQAGTMAVNHTTALLIWKLYMLDTKAYSTENIQDQILALCGATNSASDVILLDIVKRIEGRVNNSWVNRVFTWTFTSDDNTPLFTPSPDGLSVCVNTNVVKQSARTFCPDALLRLDSTSSLDECVTQLKHYTVCYVDEAVKAYDSEALLMLLVSSPELFKDGGAVDMKLFVESGSLSFVVCCLAHPELRQASRTIVHAAAQYFVDTPDEDITYKDRLAVRVLLSKIMTVKVESLTPAVWVMLSQLVPIFCNPGHFLYSKSMDYLLSGPSILDDLPLYKPITTEPSDEDATRNFSWLLDTLTVSCSTPQDVHLYMKRGVVEWCLNMSNSPYAHIVTKVNALLAKLQEIPTGSSSLVTRNGSLAWSELHQKKLGMRLVMTMEREKLQNWTNNDDCGVMRRMNLS